MRHLPVFNPPEQQLETTTHGPVELHDTDLSPVYRMTCGCLGIPLYSMGTHCAGTTRVLLLKACDCDPSDDTAYGFYVRDFDINKVEGAVRLSFKEWNELQLDMQAYFQMGMAVEALHRAMHYYQYNEKRISDVPRKGENRASP